MRHILLALVLAAGAMAAEPAPSLRTDRYGDPLPLGALLRLGTERLRLGTPVSSLEFSSDGTKLLTCAQDDGRITLWDARTGKRTRQVAQLKPRGSHVRRSAAALQLGLFLGPMKPVALMHR